MIGQRAVDTPLQRDRAVHADADAHVAANACAGVDGGDGIPERGRSLLAPAAGKKGCQRLAPGARGSGVLAGEAQQQAPALAVGFIPG